jgi:hypothetical protein
MAYIRKPGGYKFTKPRLPVVPEIPAVIFSVIRRAFPAKHNTHAALMPCISGRACSLLREGEGDCIKCLTNADIYYNPKDLDTSNIGRTFCNTIEWIQKNNAWSMAKTGWSYFKKSVPI